MKLLLNEFNLNNNENVLEITFPDNGLKYSTEMFRIKMSILDLDFGILNS